MTLGGASTKDPDLMRISKIGTVGEGGTLEEGDQFHEDDDFKKFLPYEFLKRLPGIDSNNINKVTKNVKTVTELCKVPEDDLKKLIGQKNARDI